MSAPLGEGTIFAGRYRMVRCLAAGGMGTVYEVVHTETSRRRALKVMHPHLFQSDEMRERFKREAHIAGQFESEYIVDVSDAGVDEATKIPFIVMEFLDGEDLNQRLTRLGRLPAAEVLTYIQQVALALDKTHARSIVHRDLKPENLFLTAREDGSPRVKILDFGVAKLVAESATSAGATRSLGTPLYMSPEQFRVGTPLQSSADIHALGMIAYTLLVGQPYWAAEAKSAGDVIAFAMVVVLGPPESASRRAARAGVTLPPAFDAWFATMTATAPEDRYPSALEAARALATVLGGAPVLAAPPVSSAVFPAGPAASGNTALLVSAPGQQPFQSPTPWTGVAGPALQGVLATSAASSVTPGGVAFGAPPQGFAAAGAGPQSVSSVLEQVNASTGGTTATIPRERSRAPIVLAGVLFGVVLLTAGAWILFGRAGGPNVASNRDAASSAAVVVTASPSQSAPTALGAAPSDSASGLPPASSPPSSAEVTPGVVSGQAARPVATGKPRPSASPSGKPAATPVAKPSGEPLFGRD